MALRLGQQRQVLKPRLRLSGHRLEQRTQMAQHARGDVVIEAPPRVLELQQELLVAIGEERQWIVGLAESSELSIERMGIEYQDALEEGHVSWHVAPAMDLEQRRVLVIAQRPLLSAQLPQPRHELGFGINAHPQRQ